MKHWLSALALLGALTLGLGANARTEKFDFHYTATDTNDYNYYGPSIDVSAVLTTDPESAGSYQVIGITGTATFNGVANAITGLNSSYENPDNLLFPSAPYLDLGGISFNTAHNGPVNIFLNSGVITAQSDASFNAGPLTVTPVGVPEPAFYQMSAFLVLGGLGALRACKRRAP